MWSVGIPILPMTSVHLFLYCPLCFTVFCIANILLRRLISHHSLNPPIFIPHHLDPLESSHLDGPQNSAHAFVSLGLSVSCGDSDSRVLWSITYVWVSGMSILLGHSIEAANGTFNVYTCSIWRSPTLCWLKWFVLGINALRLIGCSFYIHRI